MTFDDIVIGQENGRWYWFAKGSGEPPKPFTQVPAEVVIAMIDEIKKLRALFTPVVRLDQRVTKMLPLTQKEVPDAQGRSEAPRKKARSAR